jgi:NADH dehydrogenase
MGVRAAKNILRSLSGKSPKPYRYQDVGMLATIGMNSAVAVLGRLRLSGYPAWLLWLVAHIFFLIGFRNRIVVLIDWAWAYWTYERSARIVVSGRRPE